MLGRALASRVLAAVCGSSSRESLASYDPASSSWRTSQRSLFEEWMPFSGRLPHSGTMRGGRLFELSTLERRTGASGCSSLLGEAWPTPDARDSQPEGLAAGARRMERWSTLGLQTAARIWPTPDASAVQVGESPETWLARREALRVKHQNGNGCGTPLGMAVQLWSTPNATDYKGSTKEGQRNGQLSEAAEVLWQTPTAKCAESSQTHRSGERSSELLLNGQAGGSLNPAWVESLMGFPPGWTDGPPVPAKRNTTGKPRASRKRARTEPRG